MASNEVVYYCTECNATVGENDKFCQNCGANLSEKVYEEQNHKDEIIINEKYISLNSKTTWLIALLSFTILVNIIAMIADISQMNLIQRAIDGHSISELDAAENDSRVQTIAIFQLFVFITTAIFFLVWKNQAYKNLDPLNATGREYSSGWAVGAYFVPFLNLFRPFQIMREIWRGSDPNFINNSINSNITWKVAPSNPILPLWWTFSLINKFFGYLSFRMSNQINTIQQIKNYSTVTLISDIIGIPYAIILIILAKDLNKRQEEKYKKLVTFTTDKTINDRSYSYTYPEYSEITELEKYEEIDDTQMSDDEKAKVFGKVLGLKGQIKKSDITRIYKELMEKYHPDKVSHLGEEFHKYAEKKTKDINKAYSYFKKKYGL